MFRYIVAIVAIFLATALIVPVGFLMNWQLSGYMIGIYGLLICSMILLGEHFRSRVFERVSQDPAPSFEIEVGTDRLPSVVGPDWRPRTERRTPTNQIIKRVLDVFLAGFVLMTLAVFLTVVAALVWFVAGRPVLLKQRRIGYEGREFTLYKFRTTTRDGSDDARLHALGALFREWGIDELPMLINVLNGTMTFVGPPPAIDSKPNYLNYLKPGITFGGEGTDYIENWSFWKDLKSIADFLNRRAPHDRRKH